MTGQRIQFRTRRNVFAEFQMRDQVFAAIVTGNVVAVVDRDGQRTTNHRLTRDQVEQLRTLAATAAGDLIYRI